MGVLDMNEDFVSFSLAMKLKEKGFDEKCYTFYEYDSKEFYREERIPCCNSRSDDYAAPTISQVLKWLREEKDLFVEVSVNNHTGFDFYFTIYEKGEECWIVCGFNKEWHDTYKGAAIAGIEYVLNNLI